MKILVTGGAGFIGSNLVHMLLHQGYQVITLDKLTYAGNIESLEDVLDNPSHTFIQGDIYDGVLVAELLAKYVPDAVMHLAAESHVDRSIQDPSIFIETNINGTFRLLEETRKFWSQLSAGRKLAFRFVHISTDEVYGSLGRCGAFMEETAYAPNSPYSASKAASDHLVRAYFHTYGLPAIITNCSNNYGPYQFPEKLIPLMIMNAMAGKNLPVYGNGLNVRDWLYVEDHCRALELVLRKGRPGEKYNIGGNNEKTNIEIVQYICNQLDKLSPKLDMTSYCEQIVYVADRPGHDYRYAIDAKKIFDELGWKPQETFHSGIKKTINWYMKNQLWVQNVGNGTYKHA